MTFIEIYISTRAYLNVMALHVVCCISEETIHHEALRVNAVDQRIRRLENTQKNVGINSIDPANH